MQFNEFVDSTMRPRKVNVLLTIGKTNPDYLKPFKIDQENIIIDVESDILNREPFINRSLNQVEIDLISENAYKYDIVGLLIGDSSLKYTTDHHRFLKMLLERRYILIYYVNHNVVKDYFEDNELILLDKDWNTKVWPFVSMRKSLHVKPEKVFCSGLNFKASHKLDSETTKFRIKKDDFKDSNWMGMLEYKTMTKTELQSHDRSLLSIQRLTEEVEDINFKYLFTLKHRKTNSDARWRSSFKFTCDLILNEDDLSIMVGQSNTAMGLLNISSEEHKAAFLLSEDGETNKVVFTIKFDKDANKLVLIHDKENKSIFIGFQSLNCLVGENFAYCDYDKFLPKIIFPHLCEVDIDWNSTTTANHQIWYLPITVCANQTLNMFFVDEIPYYEESGKMLFSEKNMIKDTAKCKLKNLYMPFAKITSQNFLMRFMVKCDIDASVVGANREDEQLFSIVQKANDSLCFSHSGIDVVYEMKTESKYYILEIERDVNNFLFNGFQLDDIGEVEKISIKSVKEQEKQNLFSFSLKIKLQKNEMLNIGMQFFDELPPLTDGFYVGCVIYKDYTPITHWAWTNNDSSPTLLTFTSEFANPEIPCRDIRHYLTKDIVSNTLPSKK